MSLYQFYNNEIIIKRNRVLLAQGKERRERQLEQEEKKQLEVFK